LQLCEFQNWLAFNTFSGTVQGQCALKIMLVLNTIQSFIDSFLQKQKNI